MLPPEIDDLTIEDLPALAWAGPPRHIEHVAQALERVSLGEVEYLVVRDDAGLPISKGGVDFANPHHVGAGAIFQLATREDLRGHGHGTLLIAALEDRVRRRGVLRCELGVEPDNPRALILYERLGYRAFDRIPVGWEAEDEHGSLYWHQTEEILMTKDLTAT